MATKNYSSLSFNDKHQQYLKNVDSHPGEKYSSLNLNRTQKCSILSPVQIHSNSNIIDNKQFDNTTPHKHEEKLFTSKTSMINLNLLKSVNKFEEIESKKQWKKNDATINSSTLSLHISAYENSIIKEPSSFDNERSKILTWKNHQLNNSAAAIMGMFEFPRQQQENQYPSNPEVMQFKASQKLLPQKSSSSKNKNQKRQKNPAKNAFDLTHAHEADTRLVKSQVRSTIRAAMDPSNPNYMITSIKLDFSTGPLLIGDDPNYVYRSPEMTIEAIPVGPSPFSECEGELSIASETINNGARQCAGGNIAIYGNNDTLETNPSMLNAMADEYTNDDSNAYYIYQQYLQANNLTEDEYPFLPNENDASHISQEDIVKWIEDGGRAITSQPQQAAWEVTSKNSFSNLESITSSPPSGKDEIGIRELSNDPNYFDDDGTLVDVASITSDESMTTSDFSDVPLIHTPHSDGLRQNGTTGQKPSTMHP